MALQLLASLGALSLAGCQCGADKKSSNEGGPSTITSLAADQKVAQKEQTQAPTEKELTAEEKSACLKAPVSPGTAELPEIDELLHVVEGQNHLFVPKNLSNHALDMYGPNALARRMQTALGTKEKFGFGACGKDPKYSEGSCAILRVKICEPWVSTVTRWAPVARAEGLGVKVEISDPSVEP